MMVICDKEDESFFGGRVENKWTLDDLGGFRKTFRWVYNGEPIQWYQVDNMKDYI